MSDTFFSSDTLFALHEWVGVATAVVLGCFLGLAVLQFVLSRSTRFGQRFLNRGSLRTGLIVSFVVIAVVPTMALGLFLAERSAHQRYDRMSDRLERNAEGIVREVNHVLDMYVAGVTTAASTASEAGNFDAESLTRVLMLNHATYESFLTMLATDENGAVIAATSNMGGFLTSIARNGTTSVSDRSYFRVPMQTGEPFISEIFRGRALGSDAIVGISAPLRNQHDQPIGVIEGSVNLGIFRRLQQDRPYLEDTNVVMVDQDGQVIFSSSDDGPAEMESVLASPVAAAARMASDGSSFDYTIEADGDQHRLLGVSRRTENDWRVFVSIDVDRIAAQMRSDYGVSAALVAFAIILSLLAAGSIVVRVSRAVNEMSHAIDHFNADGDGENILTPASTPREFRPLFAHFRRRAANLRRAHKRLRRSIEAGEELRRELTRAVATKEAEVADRTADLEEANKQLHDLSKSDALTGIPNRREFDAFQLRMWRSALRNRKPIATILMDIDFFKIYNDALGHQQGDNCLTRVAQALHDCASRPLDLVARYGGEEFAAILGDANIHEALIVAERMRKAVLDLRIPHPGSGHEYVSISVGVVSTVPKTPIGSDVLLRSTDEALYYAKAAGRNCVVYPKDGEYVTYDACEFDGSETNVIAMLSGKIH
ncbi:MAG: diguanylate cyclase [Gammaproteobacteria bacterium]|nr:diguanylate cyclase [Gammaproteobacteria bacterium]